MFTIGCLLRTLILRLVNDAGAAEIGASGDSSHEETDEKKATENGVSAKKLEPSSSADAPTVKIVESKLAHFKGMCTIF